MSGSALVMVHEQVRDELRRADAKATTLLSLVGAALAGVVALTGRPLHVVTVVLLWCAAVPIGAAVVALLSAIRPRLTPARPVPGSWLHATQAGPRALLAACAEGHPDRSLLVARDVCVLAGLAVTKYRRIGHAVSLLLVGLAVIAAALPVEAVLR